MLFILGQILDCFNGCHDKHDMYFFNGERIRNQEPCDETCCDSDYIYYNGECVLKSLKKIWQCNGKYLSWNEPCIDTCRGFESIKREYGLGDPDTDQLIDTYWKCPNESKCVSSYHLCNNKKSGQFNGCTNNTHKSREFCDNPNKYVFNLNCSSLNLIQCPGNKSQQCIYSEELCNGIYDCTDRYASLFQIDFNIKVEFLCKLRFDRYEKSCIVQLVQAS